MVRNWPGVGIFDNLVWSGLIFLNRCHEGINRIYEAVILGHWSDPVTHGCKGSLVLGLIDCEKMLSVN